MASGRRRLGPFLSEHLLLQILRLLDSHPAGRGGERPVAQALLPWCAGRWPELHWQWQPYGAAGANLVASAGDGPLLYSHLDISLPAGADERAITGADAPPGPIDVRGSSISGFGLAVARAPAAAALVAFTNAQRGTLLLAGSGTHRRGGQADGLQTYLRTAPPPTAAIIAKCGPPGVLWEEPGAAYLRVRVIGEYGAALAPDSASPPGGIAAHAGVVLDALARWRRDYLASRGQIGQLGAQAGLGALHSGSAQKPDLLPGELIADLYVVTLPGEDVPALGTELAARLRVELDGTALAGCALDVRADPVHPAASTPRSAGIVRAAEQAWQNEFGSPAPPIHGWSGSTDGVVLRGHGIDTVRLGPQSTRAAHDPRRDVLSVDQLLAFSRVYAELLRHG